MSQSPFRICLVAPLPPPYGGIANWTVLVLRFIRKRNDFTLNILNIATRWRDVDDLNIWKRVIGGGVQLIRDFILFLSMLSNRPNVIHLTTSGQLAAVRDIFILATAKFLGIPTVYHIRFGRVPDIALNNTMEWKILIRPILMASVVIAIDPATFSAITQLCPKVIVKRIPNGIDLSILPEPSFLEVKTVIYLGWVIPTKGVAELCQAWSQLSLPGWRCLVVGPGSELYRQELRDHFHPSNLEFIVEQSHEDAMRLLAASDVLVLPSYSEGFPNVILEAMALGKPIIATRVGAIPEMLANDCGIVVPHKDVVSLSSALSMVCSDAVLRHLMGQRAQHKAYTEYSMDKVMEQLMSVWREVSDKHQ